MSSNKVGRPVDLSGINIDEIEIWMRKNKTSRKVIICQSIISLNNGASMTKVCDVLGVTRESVRLWKEQFRQYGLQGVLKEKKVGKRSKLNADKIEELKKIVKTSPKKQGYKTKKWTGVLVQDYVLRRWNFKISLRTAQLWLIKVH
jgi:transposase